MLTNFPKVMSSLFNVPSSRSLFQVHALWLVRGKSFKKKLNHGRDSAALLVWQVIWSQSSVERRRREGRNTNLATFIHFPCPAGVLWWVFFVFMLFKNVLLRINYAKAHRLCHVFDMLLQEPSIMKLRSYCRTLPVSVLRTLKSEVFMPVSQNFIISLCLIARPLAIIKSLAYWLLLHCH